MKREKGFTLIELLVVIAVIGILAAMVLAGFAGARDRARNARITSALAQVRAEAEMIFGVSPHSYVNLCEGTPPGTTLRDDDGPLDAIRSDIMANNNNVPSVCRASTNAYCVSAQLIASPARHWCVDSTGASRRTSDPCGAAVGPCPAAVAN